MDNDDPVMMVMVVMMTVMAMMVPMTDYDNGRVVWSGIHQWRKREANKRQQDKGQVSFHNCNGFRIKH